MTTREIFKMNLNNYIIRSGKNKRMISEEMKIPYTTLVEWANGKKFPRANGIEILADYFGILKSDLLEEKDSKKTSANNSEGFHRNTIKIAGRDGSLVERNLTDEQLDLIKKMIEQLPDADNL